MCAWHDHQQIFIGFPVNPIEYRAIDEIKDDGQRCRKCDDILQ